MFVCVSVGMCVQSARSVTLRTILVCFRVFNWIYILRISHAERGMSMKRQLVEDLKTKLKFLQEMEKSYRGQVEDLERKVLS